MELRRRIVCHSPSAGGEEERSGGEGAGGGREDASDWTLGLLGDMLEGGEVFESDCELVWGGEFGGRGALG